MSKQSVTKKQKTSKTQKQIEESSETSHYTAEFFTEEQQKELKFEETKNKILEYLKKQKIMGKKTFKDVKIELQKKFGIIPINTHKNWLIAKLNNQKSDSKFNTPGKNSFQIKQSGNQLKKPIINQNQENQLAKSEKNQSSSEQEQQSNILAPFKYESLSSNQKLTENEDSQTLSDGTYLNSDRVQEIISTNYKQMTADAMKNMYDRLLVQVPEVLETQIFEKLSQKIDQTLQRIEELDKNVKDLDVNQIQQLIREGIEEIQDAFKLLIDDIKKASPTIGIVSQEQLANHSKRAQELNQVLNKRIDEILAILSQNQQKFTKSEEITQKNLKAQEALNSEQTKTIKILSDKINKAQEENYKVVNESMEIINNNIKIVNSRVTVLEKQEIKNQGNSIIQQQAKTSQQAQNCDKTQVEPGQVIQPKFEQDILQTVQRFNSMNDHVRFIIIEGKQFLFDKVSKKIYSIHEQLIL